MQVVYGRDELAHEGARLVVAKFRTLLALDERQQLSSSGVLCHQAVQCRPQRINVGERADLLIPSACSGGI